MKNLPISILTLLLLFLTTACQSDSPEHSSAIHEDTTEIHNHTMQDADAEIFEGRGTVISIPPSKRHVIVQHGDIPGFMNAMTMPLNVSDTTLLDHVAPHDSIWFEIETRANETSIRKLEVIEHE